MNSFIPMNIYYYFSMTNNFHNMPITLNECTITLIV